MLNLLFLITGRTVIIYHVYDDKNLKPGLAIVM